jgi:hypothetical protein
LRATIATLPAQPSGVKENGLIVSCEIQTGRHKLAPAGKKIEVYFHVPPDGQGTPTVVAVDRED